MDQVTHQKTKKQMLKDMKIKGDLKPGDLTAAAKLFKTKKPTAKTLAVMGLI